MHFVHNERISAKKLKGLTYHTARSVIGKTMSHAFMLVKTHGLQFRNAEFASKSHEKIATRINVLVEDGVVRKSWCG